MMVKRDDIVASQGDNDNEETDDPDVGLVLCSGIRRDFVRERHQVGRYQDDKEGEEEEGSQEDH
jgi:hypothetical protein